MIYQGDTTTILRTLPDESVNCCITSPPYWGLRQYLFNKAVILRYNLTEKERQYIEKELEKHGIKPKI